MIKPYCYNEKMGITIYYGDSYKIMPQFPDKGFNLLLTDPPYGISIVKKSGRLKQLKYRQFENDNKTLDLSFLFPLSKNQIIFGGNYFKLPISRGWIVWDKQGGKKVDYGDCELIWTSFDKVPRIITYIWDGFRRDGEKNIKRVHPTQKPVGLMEYLIKTHTNENDIILDPFMGSGTALVAACKLGRKAVGIEISEKYCEIAVKRIKKETDQMKLF